MDAGIQKNWTGWGNTTFYGEYGRVEDGVTGLVVSGATAAGALAGLGAQGVIVDSEMTWWGLGAVQTIDAAAMDVYLGYRRYSADATIRRQRHARSARDPNSRRNRGHLVHPGRRAHPVLSPCRLAMPKGRPGRPFVFFLYGAGDQNLMRAPLMTTSKSSSDRVP